MTICTSRGSICWRNILWIGYTLTSIVISAFPGDSGSGDSGIEKDCGVSVWDSWGVLGVEFTRDRVFGRRLA